MPLYFKIPIVFFSLFFFATHVQAQQLYEIDTKYAVHELNPYMQVYPDPDNKFETEDILNDTTINYFMGDKLKRGFAGEQVYWGKIKVSTSDSLKGWTLHARDIYIGGPAWNKGNSKVDFFGYVDGELVFHKKAGPLYPKKERDIAKNWVLNRISMDEFPVNEEVTLIIHAQGNSFGFPAFFNIDLRSPTQGYYHQIYQFNNTFNIFMFGVTFIIFLYHVLQYIYLKEGTYLYFSIWLFFCCMTMFMSIGGILGNIYMVSYIFWMCIANGIYFVFWFFGRSFIQSRSKFPKIDKLILGLSFLILLEIMIAVFMVTIVGRDPHNFNVGMHYQIMGALSIMGVILSIIIAFQKDNFARYFGIGSLIGYLFLTIGSIWSVGIIKGVKFDPYSTGMFFQIIIFSFGIAYRRQSISKAANNEKLDAERKISEMQRIKDLDEIKSKFFANISHEFRTPLSLIQGPLSQAVKSNYGDQEKYIMDSTSFDLLNRNSNRLQTLVDQLLDLSKLESGHVHLSLSQGGMVSFLKSLVFSFESMAERNAINLNTHFPSELENAFYDKDKLEKIVSNLVSNAIKYTPENGIVSFTATTRNGQLCIEVSDTGKGIKSEDQKKIFERFYRVEGSEEKGSGIGLALTKELVELHKGRINVSSTVGEGTTFKVRLPYLLKDLPENRHILNQVEESSVNLEKAFALPETITKESQNGALLENENEKQLVLVVEDNADLRTYIHSIVSKQYRTIMAKDGDQGERMAFEHIPDVIVSDVMMPKKDGFALTNSLKNNQKTSHIPIVMLTAKAGFDNKMEGLSQGADAYLTKPFKEAELLIRLKNLIESRKKMWAQFQALDLTLVKDMNLQSVDDQFVQEVFHCIKENIDNELFGVEDIARAVGFSRSQLHRKLKAVLNKSANQLIVEMRMNEARRMLEHKTGSVSEVAFSVGYSSLAYFTKSFKKQFGMLPSKVGL